MSDWPHSQDGIDPAMRPTHPDTIQTVTLTEAEQAALASGWNLALEAAAKAVPENHVLCDHMVRSINDIQDAIRALSMPAPTRQEAEWQPIETAPYDTEVLVKVGRMTFPAALRLDASMDDDGNECDQWEATVMGQHPPCWSGGACWESNAEGSTSLQPEAWMPAPPQPTEGGE